MLYKYIRHRQFTLVYGHIRFHNGLARYYAWFYTAWIAHNVRKIGLHTEVEPGLYLVNGKKYIEIGDYCLIGRNSHITAHEMPQYNTPVKISIGDGCMFGPDMHITAVNSIRIGKNVRTGKSVLISDNSHGDPKDMALRNIAPNARPIYSKGAIVIGDNVWIGEKAAIWPESRSARGHHRSNAVVTKNIPPYSIAAGIPARIIK